MHLKSTKDVFNSNDCINLLKKCVGDGVLFKIDKPPPYISNLKISGQLDPVMLLYKEEKPILNVNLKHISQASEIGTSLADLSITGTPLECPFEDDETLDVTVNTGEPVVVSEDHYHCPLSMAEARKYLSVLSLKNTPDLPVWILTDMSDKKKSFLLGIEIKSRWRTRFWAIAHSNQIERIPIKELLEDFEKMFNINSAYKITSEVCCVFNIKEDQRVVKHSKCFLEVRWQRPSYEVNLSQANTSLIVECSVGQEDSQISRWWQQLNLLHDYLEIIKQRKQTQQVQLTYERDSIQLPSYKSDDNPKPPLSSRVLDLLQRSDSMSVCRQLVSEHNVTSALNSTIHELLEQQKGQDFTDKLWSLLIEAETYQELVECFQLVIREVRKQSVKPYIFVKNKSRVACLLRSLKAGGTSEELMLEPLELMVEMGLEKLKRDYMFMFMASQLTSEEALCQPKLPSFSEVGSGEWQLTVDQWLVWLARLHSVLELISVIHTTMSTPTLVQFTGLALATFLRSDSPVPSLHHLINNRTYQLSAPVVSKEVKSFIEGDRTFFKWLLKLSAETENHKITSTYVFLEQTPLPQRLLLDMIDHESADNTGMLSETIVQSSWNSFSKLQMNEKYSYFQLCSVSDKLPS